MVFCNRQGGQYLLLSVRVTILILIDGFLQYSDVSPFYRTYKVTILILIDGFLQLINAGTINITLDKSQSLF